jgi:outer membrane receptor for ferrienterochelin and colicins
LSKFIFTMNKKIAFILFLLFQFSFGQEKATLSGHVLSKNEGIPFANVFIKNTTIGTSSDENGKYKIELEPGTYQIQVNVIGFKPTEKTITVVPNQKLHVDFNLEESILGLNQVVVSATRGLQKRTEAPMIVTVTNSETLQKVQAISLSEGLNFQPGLRMETNCQNCGFTQVRMNGLDGAYSQILLDSRPIFSALNGVYGLDQIPANMIERIEVVRGGGSSLYGSNAIAGTINIITKEPIKSSFEINNYLGLIDGKTPDKATTVNGTVVSDDLNSGLQFFGMHRNRKPFDANNDNFTEITAMENQTFGLKSFYKPSINTKITADFHSISEFRRGGENNFNLQPFEAYITEQIASKTIGAGLTFESYTNDKNKYSVYANAQQSKNDNFYGGRADDDFGNIDLEESLKGFGNTEVKTFIAGAQWNNKQEKFLNGSGSLTLGSEFKSEAMVDEKPGFNAFVNQTLNILGIYAQQEWQVNQKLKVLGGLRADFHNAAEETVMLNPRATVLYNIKENLQWRSSYAKGFRAPQVFSEDIHARIAAGEVALVVLADNLQSETSHSFLTSFDYSKANLTSEMGFTFELFYTRLQNPFVLEQIEETLWEKRNGKGANVFGVNLEGKYAIGEKWQLQSGATIQKAVYDEAVQWSENVTNSNRNFFRSPNFYGNFIATYAPKKHFQNNLSFIYTGSMFTPHYAGFIANDQLEKTRSFHEINWKSAYIFSISNALQLEVSGGIQNVLNSYQRDFDSGINRDATYIYGPSRPRTIFIGLKLGTDLL